MVPSAKLWEQLLSLAKLVSSHGYVIRKSDTHCCLQAFGGSNAVYSDIFLTYNTPGNMYSACQHAAEMRASNEHQVGETLTAYDSISNWISL